MEFVMINYSDVRNSDRDRVTFQSDDPRNGEDKIMIYSLIRQRMLSRIRQVKLPVPGEIYNPVTAVPTGEGADFYVVSDMFSYLRSDFVEIVQECIDEVAASQD